MYARGQDGANRAITFTETPSISGATLLTLPLLAEQAQRRSRGRGWLAFCLLFVAMLGCSTADLFQRQVATPIPTRALAPTFTPTPVEMGGIIIVTPPFNGTPGVIIVPEGTDPRDVIPIPPTPTPTPLSTEAVIALTETAQPTNSPIPTETATPTPTFTPTNTATPTPTTTATPFISVESGFVALRSGPGVEFPLVAQLGPDIPIAITGQNPEGTWYEICCVNATAVWVASTHVLVNNDPRAVALRVGGTPPTPTPTLPATPTGTPTPTFTATPYPFQRTFFEPSRSAFEPKFFPTNNEFVTIWVKLYIGTLRVPVNCDPENTTPNREVPAAGYYIRVLFNNFERPPTNGVQASAPKFECSASPGFGNRFEYNLKYEYVPPDPRTLNIPAPTPTPARVTLIGDGTWTVYVIDGAGNQLSDPYTFTTQSGNIYREVYVAWERVR